MRWNRLRSHPTTPPTKNRTLLAPRKLSLSLFCFSAPSLLHLRAINSIVCGCLALACPPRSKEKLSFAFLSLACLSNQWKYSLLLSSRSLSLVRVWKYSLLFSFRSLSLFRVSIHVYASLLFLSLLGELTSVGRVALCLSRSLACYTRSKEKLSLSLSCLFPFISLSLFFLALLGELLSLSLAPLLLLIAPRKLSLFL
jgi:hypothetical protein